MNHSVLPAEDFIYVPFVQVGHMLHYLLLPIQGISMTFSDFPTLARPMSCLRYMRVSL